MQNAPFCNTFDLHKAIICIENHFLLFFFEWPLKTGFTVYEIVILNKSSLSKGLWQTDRQSKSPPPNFFVLTNSGYFLTSGCLCYRPWLCVQQWLNVAIQVMELSKIEGIISVIYKMCWIIYCSYRSDSRIIYGSCGSDFSFLKTNQTLDSLRAQLASEWCTYNFNISVDVKVWILNNLLHQLIWIYTVFKKGRI